MRLRYTLTRWDLFRAGLRAVVAQRVLLIVAVPLLVFVWWSSYSYDENQKLPVPVRIVVATLSSGICAGVGVLAGALILAAQSFLRRDRGVLGEHILEITEEGLIECTEVNRSLANWRTSFRIRETSRYAYVYVSVGNAHVIPKARPPLEGSVAEFLTELRARIQKFQQRDAPNGGPATD
jgi:hypothetical protein